MLTHIIANGILAHGRQTLTTTLCAVLGVSEPIITENEGELAEQVYCALPDNLNDIGKTVQEIATYIPDATVDEINKLLTRWSEETLVVACHADGIT